jgi:hypothetical protein
VRRRKIIDFILDPFKKLQKGGLELWRLLARSLVRSRHFSAIKSKFVVGTLVP